MDKQTIAVLIPVIVMLIPLSAVILNGWQKIIKLRIEEAKARVQVQVTPRDWKIFEELAVAGRPAAPVADEFRMTVFAVRMVKKRVQDRLRKAIDRLEDAASDQVEASR